MVLIDQMAVSAKIGLVHDRGQVSSSHEQMRPARHGSGLTESRGPITMASADEEKLCVYVQEAAMHDWLATRASIHLHAPTCLVHGKECGKQVTANYYHDVQ